MVKAAVYVGVCVVMILYLSLQIAADRVRIPGPTPRKLA